MADARLAVDYLQAHADELKCFDVEATIEEYTDVADKYLKGD